MQNEITVSRPVPSRILDISMVTDITDLVLVQRQIASEDTGGVPLVDANNIDEDKIKDHVAYVRALTNQPADIFPTLDAYRNKRTEVINYIAEKVSKGEAFAQGELHQVATNNLITYVALPVMAYMNYWENAISNWRIPVTKTQLEVIAAVAGGATVLPLAPEAIVSLSGLAVASGVKAALAPDTETKNMVSDSMIYLAGKIWKDPAARAIINDEVKSTLKVIFGIDFDASVEEHRNYLSDQVRGYVDIYLKNLDVASRESEAEIATSIVNQVNTSLQTALDGMLADMRQEQLDEQARKIKQAYRDSEIQGGIYLAGVITNLFTNNPKVAAIVTGLGESALKISSVIGAISCGALGPIGAIAGFAGIAFDIAGLFGGGESANQIIMDSINKVQESINRVQESINILHDDMARWFGVVVENQQKMMEKINEQFELLKRIDQDNYEQIQASIKVVQVQVDLTYDAVRRNGRIDESKDFDNSIGYLNTEISKKSDPHLTYDKPTVKQAIETAHTYGTVITQYNNFTSRPDRSRSAWVASNIIGLFRDFDGVDLFVGLIPVIVKQYTGNELSKQANNPVELGRAAAALAIAYSTFPEVVRENAFENGRSYIGDLRKSISDTAEVLKAGTSKDTIGAIKEIYIKYISGILDTCLDTAYVNTNNSQEIKNQIYGAGPLYPISMTLTDSGNNAGSVSLIPDYSVQKIELHPSNGRNYVNTSVELGSFAVTTWHGLNQTDQNDTTIKNADLLALMVRFGIISVETVMKYREINYTLTWVERPNPHDDPHPRPISRDVNLIDNYKLNKITVQRMNGGNHQIGDGINSGWIESELGARDNANFKRSYNYLTSDLTGSGREFSNSYDFLNMLEGYIKYSWDTRDKFIKELTKQLGQSREMNVMELDAMNCCIKYLAGVNTYITTGDLYLGTEVAGSPAATPEEEPIYSLQELIKLVDIVTQKDYLFAPNNVATRGNSDREIREYIKTEILSIAGASIDNYIDTYFPNFKDSTKLSELVVPSLSIPALMLETAAANVTGQ